MKFGGVSRDGLCLGRPFFFQGDTGKRQTTFGNRSLLAQILPDRKCLFLSVAGLNSSTGALTPLIPGPVRARRTPVSLPMTSGTHAITYVPTDVYVDDFQGGVNGLSVNASTGTLTTISGSPFGSATPRAIAAAPNRKFVFTDDQKTPSTIEAYSVSANGKLTLVTGSPFPAGIKFFPLPSIPPASFSSWRTSTPAMSGRIGLIRQPEH